LKNLHKFNIPKLKILRKTEEKQDKRKNATRQTKEKV